MRILSCSSSYRQGGIGQHFAQLVEESRIAGELRSYYATGVKKDDEMGRVISMRLIRHVSKIPPLRFSPGWKNHLSNEWLDWRVAQAIDAPATRFMGFVGASLRSFRRARDLGFEQLELVAANSHVNNVWRLHEEASRQTGIRDTWLNEAQRRKTLREYEMADVIYVHSEYVRQSFLREGVPVGKLRRMYLKVDDRFTPPATRAGDGGFRLVYVGRLDATKGIPLMLEALSRFSDPDAEMRMVGGWSTRAMRRYMEGWMRRDARIRVTPGDPLPVLQSANVFVHPSYEDGFGYAPMEALATGVPVIVTEETGMKEYVRDGENGFVVPAGSWEALLERLESIRRNPLSPRDHTGATSREVS